MRRCVSSDTYRQAYRNIYDGRKELDGLEVTESQTFAWNPESTYISNPPISTGRARGSRPKPN
ncbi:hypothetical protein CRD60_01540 [Bifidobacterium aemilianum]|uniref:Uncharacterized protein n=1 Tax=Bifidobacterium aemilianum TaxID=2493120 RepID=A0A366KAD0_9BIFI|nr:hypothetical protein [Bifidobacterium aemilianum]RBP98559.1 hypothetical protein CRD60_01540 [Bifidobacterium aemilianum]